MSAGGRQQKLLGEVHEYFSEEKLWEERNVKKMRTFTI